MSFLLESVEGGAVRGRYSIIGLEPDLHLARRRRRAPRSIARRAASPMRFAPCPEPPLAALRALIAESRIALPEKLPPMAAGLFGYLGYDMVRLMEELPPPNPDPIGIARRRHAAADRRDRVRRRAGRDHRRDAGAAGGRRHARRPRSAAPRSGSRRSSMRSTARSTRKRPARRPARSPVPPTSNTTPAEFKAMVARAKEYIAAGDIFQVVLSQRFEAPFSLPPFSLYRALRRVNPAPFLFFLDFGGFAVAGSSPEILVRVRDGNVTIRPLAGTRAARRDAARGQGATKTSCSPIRRSAPST